MERRRQILLAFLISILLFSSLCFFMITRLMQTEQDFFKEMSPAIPEEEDRGTAIEVVLPSDAIDVSESVPENSRNAEHIRRLFELSSENEDFAAWLHIAGTHIDYPIMLTPDRPDYYLRRDFSGAYSFSGTPYISGNCNLDNNNLLIYGHNMKNGTMFSDLLLYAEESFYRENPVISFDTVELSANYEIIAVFREKVHYSDEKNVFRYYEYAGELDEDRFSEYLKEIKKRSLYETDASASYGDRLITLSTCAYHTENGRFVVVAAEKR